MASETKAAECEGMGFASPITCSVKPIPINILLHAENRERTLKFVRDTAGTPSNSVLLLEGGKADTRHDTDHEPLFRQESWFHWMFGVKEPDCYGAVHVETGKSTLFIPRLPAEYAIWMGRIRTTDDFKEEYKVDEVMYVDELESYLSGLAPERVCVNYGLCHDSGKYSHAAEFPGKDSYDVDTVLLNKAMTECRVIKSELELELMRFSSIMGSEAHMAVIEHTRPGLKEYQLESLFKHFCYYYGGIRHSAYTCICATGPNGSTLHYGHAGAPNDRLIKDGDMCLFDMGGEYHCYASDLTCSFPANGKFSDDQRMVYEAVLAAQWAVMDSLKPGVNYLQMQEVSYRTSLTKLTEGGLLTGDVEGMMAVNLGATFMPHGLGHFIGLDTHDVGGYPDGTSRSKEDGYKSLRTVRELKENMTLTVEPGVYFVDHLLDAALADPAKAAFINADVLARFRGWGGVRIEDVVRITADGIENFTWCPRTVEDIEAVYAGTKTSRFDLYKKF